MLKTYNYINFYVSENVRNFEPWDKLYLLLQVM